MDWLQERENLNVCYCGHPQVQNNTFSPVAFNEKMVSVRICLKSDSVWCIIQWLGIWFNKDAHGKSAAHDSFSTAKWNGELPTLLFGMQCRSSNIPPFLMVLTLQHIVCLSVFLSALAEEMSHVYSIYTDVYSEWAHLECHRIYLVIFLLMEFYFFCTLYVRSQ